MSRSILLTVAYSAQFGHALSAKQIFRRLIGEVPRDIDGSHFLISLRGLVHDRLLQEIKTKNGVLYTTPQTKMFDFSQNLVDQKYSEIQPLLKFASKIPFVKAVVVTGSVAAGAVRAKDDIDFLIITQENRLWITRPLIVLYGWMKGKRRSWHTEEPNSWCFNFWLEETHLALPKKRWTLYSAYELCQATFVYHAPCQKNAISTEIAFLLSNRWAFHRLPVYFSGRVVQAKKRELLAESKVLPSLFLVFAFFAYSILSPVLCVINFLAYVAQLGYMYPHKTIEQVSRHTAFFHPRDTKKQVYLGWKRGLHGKF